MSYDPASYFNTAKLTLRAILHHETSEHLVVFDEEPPNEDGLLSWATRLRRNNETTVSWHIVADENGLVDISRSVSFLTASGKPMDHTVLLKQIDLAETGKVAFSSLIIQVILGSHDIPIRSRKEAKEWVRVAEQDADHVFALGMQRIMTEQVVLSSVLLSDEAELFSTIHHMAESQVGHSLARHKETWADAGVPFRSSDIYHDAFVNRAAELVHPLTRGMAI